MRTASLALPCLALFTLVPRADLRSAPLDPPPPAFTNMTRSGNQLTLRFSPFPAAQQFRLLSTTNIGSPFVVDPTGTLSGFDFTATSADPFRFYVMDVTPLSSNAVLSSIAANRLAYGPTPDLLDRLALIGPGAYIAEQLAPETVTENAANSHTNIPFIDAKFAGPSNSVPLSATTGPGSATLSDFRAWHILRAVGADRQLLEVLLQFLENHFVTQHTKASDFLQAFYADSTLRNRVATELEYRENLLWRQVLLNPTGTFRDLLRISCESPAMIIYLDTVASRADGGRVPNENFAREIMELFAMGVDNGYDQFDITSMSTNWTGWSVELVEVGQVFNPFAPKATTQLTPGAGTAYTNLVGVWALNFRTNYRTSRATVLFPGKTVPARFGPPWAGVNYQLNIPARTGTNGIQDGYDVINHLSDLPFTQEFMSVKLCRLLVHDDFAIGYDFTSPSLSAEGQLVKQCMMAWETNTPRGQIRKVLQTIVNSDLFRAHTAAGQKVKTPLEYIVSAIRALRSSTNGSGMFGTFTALTDGYSLTTPLNRMGSMALFDRAEPDGYPESAGGWISAGTLAERVRWTQSLLIASGQTGHTGSQGGTGNDAASSTTDPVTLLRSRLPLPADQLDAAKVADLFLGLLFPGEGAANLNLHRTAAINFLNTSDNGQSTSLFSSLTVSNTAGTSYDTRVRGLVAMLMTLQRFQEQ
jgi:uncharacterized protein (DUF1800 family)